MTTPTIQIKQDFDRKLAKIRSNPDLSHEARRRYITEAFEDAQRRYRGAIEEEERKISERVSRAEKAVMRIGYPPSASEGDKETIRMSYRNAYDTAYRAGHGERPQVVARELERLLERAERSGDRQLADAVYHVATEKGIRSVADAYLASRPEQKRRWEEYTEARQEADSLERRLGHAMVYGLMKPAEVDGRAAGRVEQASARRG